MAWGMGQAGALEPHTLGLNVDYHYLEGRSMELGLFVGKMTVLGGK